VSTSVRLPHCSGTGGQTETDGCSSGSLPLGTSVEVKGASKPGTLVYNSWLTMQEKGEADPDTCAYNDLALISIDPADVGSVNPSVPGFGGPTGTGTVGDLGSTVYTYGNSELRGGVTKLSPKQGVVVQNESDGWSHIVVTLTPGVPGDSGSGFLNGSGEAIGILSTLQLAPLAGTNGVGDIAKELAYLHANGGFARCNWCMAPSRSSRTWWKRSSAHRQRSVELAEEIVEVQRCSDHRDLLAARGTRPLLAGAVAVELDPVAIGVIHIDRLADAVVGCAAERDARLREPPQRIGERAPVGVADRDVKEAGAPHRGRRCSFRVPGIEADVVVVTTGGDESGVVTDPLLQLEAEHAAVEVQRPVELGHFEMHVADVDAGVDRVDLVRHPSRPAPG